MWGGGQIDGEKKERKKKRKKKKKKEKLIDTPSGLTNIPMLVIKNG